MYKYIFVFLFFYKVSFAQNVEWATSITNIQNVKNEYENNSFELALGPPVFFSNISIESQKHDHYAEGYLILPDKNKKLQIDFGFKKPTIANKIFIGGLLNQGVMKKCVLILKDKKTKTIFSFSTINDTSKTHAIRINFPLETVYGVRIFLDQSKANNWNILKGIGVYKAQKDDTISFKPDFVADQQHQAQKELVENQINSENCAEFNPKVSSDGKKLFFVRDCGDQDSKQQIWLSHGSLDYWNSPIEVNSPLNNNGHNYVVSTSLDPKVIYLGNGYNRKAETDGNGLSRSVWSEVKKEWSIPEKVELPSLLNNGEIENYCVSPDQQTIIIAMERADGIGKTDLYASFYNKYKKVWEDPINLGPDINTEFPEDFPYIAIDNKTLFFSSSGRIGLGGYDIYVTKKLDDTWTKWTKPLNMGEKINSKTDDFGLSIGTSGDIAYFSSVNISSEKHNIDIYKVKLTDELKQPGLISLEGKVTSNKNGVPLNASIALRNTNRKKENLTLTTDTDGRFTHILQFGNEYEIEIESPRHFKQNETISLLNNTPREPLFKNYKLNPFLDSGQVAVLRNIQFQYSSTNFTPESDEALNELFNMVSQQKNMIVEISGHSDDKGSDTFNLKLSRWRAAAVVDFLVSKGIRPWRLKSVGHGETSPIASNDTEEGRALNRRVEMIILDDDFTRKQNKQKKEKSKNKVSDLLVKSNSFKADDRKR